LDLQPHHHAPERAAAAAAAAAALLAISKVALYWYTGSMVVAVSAMDSSMDVVVSLLNRRALIFARQSPDAEHPYGHGKAESIAALGQGALLVGASAAIIVSAIEMLYRIHTGERQPLVESWFTVLFFLGAALVSMGITYWLDRNAKIHNSPALKGDAAHYQSDVFANLGSAAGLTSIFLTKWLWLDPILAALFAGKIAHSGFDLLRTSVHELMDHDVSEDVKKSVEAFARRLYPSIVDIHAFRGRRSGQHYLFDFHVTLPKHLSFLDVHEIVDELEEKIRIEFKADTVIHADPDEVSTQ
jgi:ferrous-iron efflux pump FieF